MKNSLSPLAARLKQARTRKGLSQKSLGILAGMDEFVASARMNQYEKGKHLPDYSTIKRIAAALKIPVPFFYCESDDLAALLMAVNDKDSKVAEKLLAALLK